MRGICIDPGNSAILRKGQTYFLFDHGPNNFYVSLFDRPGSHCGSFQRRYFELIDEQPRKRSRYELDRFVARVNRPRNGYLVGDEYIISEVDDNGYFHVFLKSKPNGGPIGSYIHDFFEIIEPYERARKPEAVEKPGRAVESLIDPAAAITLDKDFRSENEATEPPGEPLEKPVAVITHISVKKAKPKQEKKPRPSKAEKLEAAGQLNIFDFLEG